MRKTKQRPMKAPPPAPPDLLTQLAKLLPPNSTGRGSSSSELFEMGRNQGISKGAILRMLKAASLQGRLLHDSRSTTNIAGRPIQIPVYSLKSSRPS